MAKGDKQNKEGKGKQKLTTKEKQDKKKEKAKDKQPVGRQRRPALSIKAKLSVVFKCALETCHWR